MRSFAPLLVLMGTLVLVGCKRESQQNSQPQPPGPTPSPAPAPPPATTTPPPPVRDMSISQFHTSLSLLTDAEAASILSDANQVLQEVSGDGDVSCTIGLRRSGPVTTFTTGDGEIDSQEEFDEIIKLPGQIKVVNAINYCGGYHAEPGSMFIGCAPIGGSSLVVVRLENPGPHEEGILWAHEYGHNCGLDHRSAADNEVMNAGVTPNHTFVNDYEKNAYEQNQQNQPAIAAALGPASREAAATTRAAGAARDAKSFVRTRYIEGLPHDEASAFGPEVVDDLIRMLDDPLDAKWRANIVALLGIIGDPRAVDPMIKVVEEGNGVLTRSEYAAKKSALAFLGAVVRKDKDLTNPATAKAFNYLKQGVEDPMIWSQRVQWTGPFSDDKLQRDWQLTKSATWGLVKTGKPEAAQSIGVLQQKLDSLPQVPADVKGVLTEARAALKVLSELKVPPEPTKK
jgi:hypothetical protein